QDWNQTTCVKNGEYLGMVGSPASTSWGPAMGNAPNANLNGFSHNAAVNDICNNYQDEFAVINQTITMFADDYQNTVNLSTLINLARLNLNPTWGTDGYITYAGDADCFRLWGVVSGSTFRMIGNTLWSIARANLDLEIKVYGANSGTISNPTL